MERRTVGQRPVEPTAGRSGRWGAMVAVALLVVATGAACGDDDQPTATTGGGGGGTTTSLDLAALPTVGDIDGMAAVLIGGGIRCDDLHEVEVVEKGRDGPLPVQAGECTTDGGTFGIEVYETPEDVPELSTADCGDESAQTMDGEVIASGNRSADAVVAYAPDAEAKQTMDEPGLAGLWGLETAEAEQVEAATGLVARRTTVVCSG